MRIEPSKILARPFSIYFDKERVYLKWVAGVALCAIPTLDTPRAEACFVLRSLNTADEFSEEGRKDKFPLKNGDLLILKSAHAFVLGNLAF